MSLLRAPFKVPAVGSVDATSLSALGHAADHRAGPPERQDEEAVEGEPAEKDAETDAEDEGSEGRHGFQIQYARGLSAAVVLILTMVACAPRDPVDGLIGALEEAAEDRDADAIRELLAEDFRGPAGVDRAEAHAMARRYLTAYESVRLEVYDVHVTRTDGEAQVRARVDFTGSARRLPGLEGMLPPSASYVFDLRLARRGESWSVAGAEWRSALPAPSP